MSTYSDHEQRILDQQSGAEMDRRAARSRETTAVAIRHESLEQRVGSYDHNWSGCRPEDSVHRELRSIIGGYQMKLAAYERALLEIARLGDTQINAARHIAANTFTSHQGE